MALIDVSTLTRMVVAALADLKGSWPGPVEVLLPGESPAGTDGADPGDVVQLVAVDLAGVPTHQADGARDSCAMADVVVSVNVLVPAAAGVGSLGRLTTAVSLVGAALGGLTARDAASGHQLDLAAQPDVRIDRGGPDSAGSPATATAGVIAAGVACRVAGRGVETLT